MRRVPKVSKFVFVLGLAFLPVLSPVFAGAEKLSWKELAGRPEFWPHECQVLKPVSFVNGTSIDSGQTVSVLEVRSKEIVLVTTDGSASFSIGPEDTDLLEIANRDFKNLSPAERDLSYAALLARTELWPSRISITSPVLLGQSDKVAAGEQAQLLGFDGTRFIVLIDRLGKRFQIEPSRTDILTQARSFLRGKPNSSPFGGN